MSDEYRVNLDIYNGPVDLLLYLIRRDELDIYDIPISRITEQYMQHVDLIRTLDPDLAGEFLVMAATLMEIKTRMLLPTPPPQEADDGEPFDPRGELVRQLLEYKAFKDAAGDLRESAIEQAMTQPRRPPKPEGPPGELDIEDVQVWDLMDAFSRVLTQIGQDARVHEVIYDDTPIELHEQDILDLLTRDGPTTFADVFRGRQSRRQFVGLFIALLQLGAERQVLVGQDQAFGEITLELNPDAPSAAELADDAADRPQPGTGRSSSQPAASADEQPAAAGTPEELPHAPATGRYESASSDDDEGGEAGEYDDDGDGQLAPRS